MATVAQYRIALVKEKNWRYAVHNIDEPMAVVQVTRKITEGADRESMIVILLNAANDMIGVNVASVGTLNSALCHPREIFKSAILANAASIMLVHNHPSGHTRPSQEDKRITRILVTCGRHLDIPVMDHLIITPDDYFSFREGGILEGIDGRLL